MLDTVARQCSHVSCLLIDSVCNLPAQQILGASVVLSLLASLFLKLDFVFFSVTIVQGDHLDKVLMRATAKGVNKPSMIVLRDYIKMSVCQNPAET